MSKVSRSSRASTSSSKNDVDVKTSNVLETLTVAITNDFYSTSYHAAEKVQNNMAFVDNYKMVVSNKINILRSSIDTVRMFLATAVGLFNKNVTSKLDANSYLKILCEYLVPGEELNYNQQSKLFGLCLIHVMDATNEFLNTNMSIIVSNTTDQKMLNQNMLILKKKIKQLISEFKLIKLNSEKAVQGGRADPGGDQREAAILELLRDKSMLKMELEEAEEKILKLEEQKKALLNRIRELGDTALAVAKPSAPVTSSYILPTPHPIFSAPANGGGLSRYTTQPPAQISAAADHKPAPLFGAKPNPLNYTVGTPAQIMTNGGYPTYEATANPVEPKEDVGIHNLLELPSVGDDLYSMIGPDDDNKTIDVEL